MFLLFSLSFAGVPAEYELLKRFRETGDVGTAFFLLENYPEAVFGDELRVELADLLLRGGERELARRVLEKVNLRNVRDDYGKMISRLWMELGLDPKPLLLRFPELSTDFLGKIRLDPKEEEEAFSRLIRKRKFKEVLKFSKSCFLRGMALYRMRRFRESLEELEGCPDERSKTLILLDYLKLRDLEGAERFVRRVKDGELYFKLGFMLLSSGDYDRARELILLSGPDNRSLFYAGVIEFIKGRYLLAYESFSEAEVLAKEDVERARIYFWKAKTLKKLGFEDLSIHFLELASRMTGFYSVVAGKLLGKRIEEEASPSYPLPDRGIADRLIAIKDLGFSHYMRLEAFKNIGKFTPADVLKIVRVDPYLAIKVAVRAFGTNSDVYRAVAFPTPFGRAVRRASIRFGVNRALIYAVMRQESLFNEKALSRSGARGLMQLMESTARWTAERFGIKLGDIYDVETNVTIGTAYIRYLLDLWKGDLVRAIASYNAGPGAVRGWKDYGDDFLFIETIPYDETRNFVKKVLLYYYIYSEKLSRLTSPDFSDTRRASSP